MKIAIELEQASGNHGDVHSRNEAANKRLLADKDEQIEPLFREKLWWVPSRESKRVMMKEFA